MEFLSPFVEFFSPVEDVLCSLTTASLTILNRTLINKLFPWAIHEFLTFILITLLVWADWGLVVGPLNSGFLACILGKTHGTRLSSFSQGLVFWSRRRVNICVKSSLLKCLVGSHPALPNDTKFNHLFRLLMHSLCISSRNETLGSSTLISCFVIHEQNAGVGKILVYTDSYTLSWLLKVDLLSHFSSIATFSAQHWNLSTKSVQLGGL